MDLSGLPKECLTHYSGRLYWKASLLPRGIFHSLKRLLSFAHLYINGLSPQLFRGTHPFKHFIDHSIEPGVTMVNETEYFCPNWLKS